MRLPTILAIALLAMVAQFAVARDHPSAPRGDLPRVDGVLVTFDDFEPGSAVHWGPLGGSVTAVGPPAALAPVTVSAYPNPFNPQTTISFDLPRAAEVSLAVFDPQGRQVRALIDARPMTAGSHQRIWDGRDARGRSVASGLYVYRFTAGGESQAGKLTVLK